MNSMIGRGMPGYGNGFFTSIIGLILGANARKRSAETAGFSHTSTKSRSNRVKIRSYCCRWQPKRMTRAERKIYRQKMIKSSPFQTYFEKRYGTTEMTF